MKYNIEGNIDFFSELYKSLDEEDSISKTEIDNNLCLITNQPLTDKFIQLNCSHKFNYIPLYYDVYNHKKKFNNMEASSNLLKVNEIRCPYCRTKQIGVLPYYPDIISDKINGVNFYEPGTETIIHTQPKISYSFGKCEFTITTPTQNSQDNTLKLVCPVTYVTKIECDNKTYCWRHSKMINKIFEKEKKTKEKEVQKKLKQEEKQKEKQKEKEQQKKLKQEEKQKEKEQQKSKKKIPLSIIDVEEENVIISSSSITIFTSETQNSNSGCCQIIKTGTNKGNYCGLEILNDSLCKRHYNLKNKNNNINNNINI
jgi:hypothetical protein